MSTETITSSRTYTLAAEVGLLTRNIKIIGAEYPLQQQQAFGARVLVGAYVQGEHEYIGLYIFTLYVFYINVLRDRYNRKNSITSHHYFITMYIKCTYSCTLKTFEILGALFMAKYNFPLLIQISLTLNYPC